MIIIGDIKLAAPIILSPLAGISSYPFRILNRKFGCELCFLEMINCHSLAYLSAKTLEMMRFTKDDRPLGIQLVGEDEEFILRSLEKLQGSSFDMVDFNAACPQKKITSRGEGAALLKTPKKLAGLLRLVIKNTTKPVSAKMRLGWDDALKANDIALSLQDAGVKALFVHGRTRSQRHSGKVNYKAIAGIKKKLKIPVVASGDILSAKLAKKMFDETGCDAVVVARGALGNPWIFREIKEYMENGILLPRPGAREVIETIKLHFELCHDFYGESRGVAHFKKFFIWYTKGFKGVKPIRNSISSVDTRDSMVDVITKFEKTILDF